MRRQSGKEAQEAKRLWEQKQREREAALKKKEKEEDRKAKAAIKAKLEQDKRERQAMRAMAQAEASAAPQVVEPVTTTVLTVSNLHFSQNLLRKRSTPKH